MDHSSPQSRPIHPAYARWAQFMSADRTPAGLVRFHTLHKMTVMAHDPAGCTALGRIATRAGGHPIDGVLSAYEQRFLRALSREATPENHIHVMRHLAGFLRRKWSAADEASWAVLLDQYRNGQVSRMVPLTLLRQSLELYGVHECVRSQLYLHAAGDAYAADHAGVPRRFAQGG